MQIVCKEKEYVMTKDFWKKLGKEIFIDGLSGMASGLFATLIIGTIIVQVAGLIPGVVGTYLFMIGKMASAMTGAGIGSYGRHVWRVCE